MNSDTHNFGSITAVLGDGIFKQSFGIDVGDGVGFLEGEGASDSFLSSYDCTLLRKRRRAEH